MKSTRTEEFAFYFILHRIGKNKTIVNYILRLQLLWRLPLTDITLEYVLDEISSTSFDLVLFLFDGDSFIYIEENERPGKEVNINKFSNYGEIVKINCWYQIPLKMHHFK